MSGYNRSTMIQKSVSSNRQINDNDTLCKLCCLGQKNNVNVIKTAPRRNFFKKETSETSIILEKKKMFQNFQKFGF